jgi:hypothetical protein
MDVLMGRSETDSTSGIPCLPGRTYAFVVSFLPIKMLAPYSVEAISGDDVKRYAQQLTLNPQHQSVLPASLTARVPDDAMNCAQIRVAIADTKRAEQDVQANRASVPFFVLSLVIAPGAEDAFKAIKAREDKLNAMSRKKNCGG